MILILSSHGTAQTLSRKVKLNIRKLLFYVLVPIFLGSIVGFLTSSSNNYNDIIQPSFAPPGILFPIVWTILYTLMGISSYIVSEAGGSLGIYIIQLVVNLLWSFLFFTFKWYLVSFLWLLILIVLVVIMIRKFFDISKISAYLQIPYLLWLIFAAILNFSIYILNK